MQIDPDWEPSLWCSLAVALKIIWLCCYLETSTRGLKIEKNSRKTIGSQEINK